MILLTWNHEDAVQQQPGDGDSNLYSDRKEVDWIYNKNKGCKTVGFYFREKRT